MKEVEYPLPCLIEGVLMENGEFIHYGKSMGYANQRQIELVESGATKIARGNEVIIALGEDVA